MANQYQSIDPTLVAINAAKKVTPQAKKTPVPSLTTKAPIQPSLNLQTQQPQAISTNITPPVAKIGGISSPFGAPNINSSPMLGGATPQEIGTRATELQSLPKVIPKTGSEVNYKTSISELGTDISKGATLQEIKQAYPEFSSLDDKVLGELGYDIANGATVEEIMQSYPELQGGSQPNMLQNIVGTMVQPLKTMGEGLAGLATKAGEYLDPDTYNPAIQAANAATMGAGLVDGSIQPRTEAENRYMNKSLSQNILDTAEGTAYTAGSLYAPITSAVFTVGGQVPYLKDALGVVGKGFSRVGEQLKYIPGYNQYRESLPPEDQARLDGLAGNMIAAFVGSKGKGKITKGDLQGYLADNFSDFASLDKAFGQSIVKGTKAAVPVVKATIAGTKALYNKIPNPVESIARKITGTADDQGKLFKAQEPRTNQLNRSVDFKNLRANSDIANEEIIKAGYKPTDTASRADAHANTMKSLWSEVESMAGKKITVDLNPLADAIDDFVIRQRKSGIVKIEPQLKELEAQAQAFRKKGIVDGADGEITKEMLNSQIKNRGDSSIGDVYKNGLKEANRVLGQTLDEAFANIPGEFSDLKRRFGALKATYEDVVKSDIKAQKAKGLGLGETFGRIEGIGDIMGAIGGLVTGKNPIPGLMSGFGKFAVGEVLAKIKDKDFLIQEGFEGLSKKTPAPKPPQAKYPIKLSSEGQLQGGATLPKPTPKTPPITVEKGAIGMGTPKPKVTPVIPPKATVAPSVSVPKKGMPKLGKEIMEQDMGSIDNNLIQEAKKYKSAYSFIEAKKYDSLGLDKEFFTKKAYGRSDQPREKVGTVGDAIKDTKLRKQFVDVLDIPIYKSEGGVGIAPGAIGQYQKQFNRIVIDFPKFDDINVANKIEKTFFEEVLHSLRSKKGRTFDGETKQYLDRIEEITAKKGSDYFGSTDKLKQIREQANKKPLPPLPKKGMPKLGKEIMEQDMGSIDNNLIQEAKKYKSADEFIKAEPVLKVKIESIKPTEGHTQENTLGINGVARKEFRNKPILVEVDSKDPSKLYILDGNHRYFEQLSRGDKEVTVKVNGKGIDTDGYKARLKSIREQANKPSLGKPKVPGK